MKFFLVILINLNQIIITFQVYSYEKLCPTLTSVVLLESYWDQGIIIFFESLGHCQLSNRSGNYKYHVFEEAGLEPNNCSIYFGSTNEFSEKYKLLTFPGSGNIVISCPLRNTQLVALVVTHSYNPRKLSFNLNIEANLSTYDTIVSYNLTDDRLIVTSCTYFSNLTDHDYYLNNTKTPADESVYEFICNSKKTLSLKFFNKRTFYLLGSIALIFFSFLLIHLALKYLYSLHDTK